ncbi:uncharacterized protein LOC104886480 [Beta vulgaris subsp. vulgaris]|uniref:uncharacterized protein LOC104886480 n=1 Tax=Beta vulgaris subsp. vulgaris TaxID=3555 RepID=UPI0025478E0A|nr:uncharacterized protein LOC104886480 [Beta vulgaris subsp. vulgaris]
MQLEAKIVDGGEVFVAGNWLPSCKFFKDEHFLAAFGLSPAFPKEASLAYIKETDPDMAERLTSAALKAARIRAEMKANKINKPSKPKDPSNPKPRKRKERTEERVEMTEKALAKARAEKEASAKKARQEPSVEVNSPRPASGDEGTTFPFTRGFRAGAKSKPRTGDLAHRADLIRGAGPLYPNVQDGQEGTDCQCPGNTDYPNRPRSYQRGEWEKRIERTFSLLDGFFHPDDQGSRGPAHTGAGGSEPEGGGRKHFDEVYQAKEAKRLAELRLEEANKKIDDGEATWKQEREDWQVERTNLTLAKDNAESAKATAEAKQAQAEKDLEDVRLKLSSTEAQLKEAQAAVSRSQEEWFNAWQKSDDCTDFCADVGQSSHKMGEDEALARLKVAFADSCPEADWNSVWSRYQELAEADAAEIKAKMAEEMRSDSDSDSDDEEEDAGSTEPPPPEQPAAEQPATGPST